ncbi:hypothetical protein KI387_026776, partial [Taxus chinensis]
ILVEVEKNSKAIEVLRDLVRNQLKWLCPQITRGVYALGDVGKKLEGVVEAMNTQQDGLDFDE